MSRWFKSPKLSRDIHVSWFESATFKGKVSVKVGIWIWAKGTLLCQGVEGCGNISGRKKEEQSRGIGSLTLRPRIWLMAADSFSVDSSMTVCRISFMYIMKALSGFLICCWACWCWWCCWPVFDPRGPRGGVVLPCWRRSPDLSPDDCCLQRYRVKGCVRNTFAELRGYGLNGRFPLKLALFLNY